MISHVRSLFVIVLSVLLVEIDTGKWQAMTHGNIQANKWVSHRTFDISIWVFFVFKEPLRHC